jgi:hypothetical protein
MATPSIVGVVHPQTGVAAEPQRTRAGCDACFARARAGAAPSKVAA